MKRSVRFLLAPLLLALSVVTACGEIDDQVVATGDTALFVSQVQPMLGARCANPSCHGNDERPLQIYAPHQNRRDPTALHGDTPLTDEEIEQNLYSAAAFLLGVDHAADAALLTKPLAPAAGGSEHGGDTQFYDTADGEYVMLRSWARTVVSEAKEFEP